MQYEISNKTIDGITDLVVWAPIKQGFIRAFENVTYESRLKLVAEALHKVRVSAREHELITPFADTAERILTLLDFRIGIADRDLFSVRFEPKNDPLFGKGYDAQMEPRRYLYLAATFDGAWEPYMRLIWDPLGPFLDLLLCNCEGYMPAGDNGFPAYAQWVRDNQLDSAIFYSTTGLTVKDQIYLSKLERLQRSLPPEQVDLALAKMTGDDPTTEAARFRKAALQPGNPAGFEVHRLALEALTVLYRLTDYYPPDRLLPNDKPPEDPDHEPGDGRFLLRAAQMLLDGWDPAMLNPQARAAYQEPLGWFAMKPPPRIGEAGAGDGAVDGNMPAPDPIPDPVPDPREVQAGLLSGYDKPDAPVTHGALLLMQITDAAKLRQFLKAFPISWESQTPDDGIYRTLAFTHKGLERMRLPHDVLRSFPKEFREGMETRSGLLGDFRENHPRRWTLPERNWPPRHNEERQARPPVELSEVDFIIQLRAVERVCPMPQAEAGSQSASAAPQHDVSGGDGAEAASPVPPSLLPYPDYRSEAARQFIAESGDPAKFSAEELDAADPVLADDPLPALIAAIGGDWSEIGAQLVAVESMHRADNYTPDSASLDTESAGGSMTPPAPPLPPSARVDHFGFRDGISQPGLAGQAGIIPRDVVKPGELLLGYPNDRGDAGLPADDKWFRNGSFLVIRKIAQDVGAFNRLIASGATHGLDADHTAALLMGRYRDGRPLVTGATTGPTTDPTDHNDFDYSADSEGLACPFAAHVRRTNPREPFHKRPAPRILRRGMSYGPRYESDPKADRGILFMAYNASIAEQFETIQRWINGGNSSGVAAAQGDPLIGVGPKSGKGVFRCVLREAGTNGAPPSERVVRIDIPDRVTRLRWGAYFFVPSRTALAKICDPALDAPVSSDPAARKGEDLIAKIEALPPQARDFQWKSILEDFRTKDPSERSTSPQVWTAIRDYRDGVYRLPLMAKKPGTKPHPVANGKFSLKNVDIFSDGADRGAAGEEQGVILVGSTAKINQVLSDAKRFSVAEQGRRVEQTVGPIYVAQDPDARYYRESADTNAALFAYGEAEAYALAYALGSAFLERRSQAADATAAQLGQPQSEAFFKLELRREYLMPVLGMLCSRWFDIPDALGPDGKSAFIDNGGWSWEAPAPHGTRRPHCPGDFMAPSREAFYPRPTDTIRDYGRKHGAALRTAALALVKAYRSQPDKLQGLISKPLFAMIADDDLLARNLVGSMTGMLAPTDGNLRAVLFDWLTDQTLWQHQAALHRLSGNCQPATYMQARDALRAPIEAAMRKRPAPDLVYRTATRDTVLGRERIRKGDLVILGLVSATAEQGGSVDTIFGGYRSAAAQPSGQPVHACPAYKMAMGSMLGIIAALLDVGRIQAQPASLIVRISGWQLN
ncbi:hypothetical protein DMP17_09775 [Pseudonocardia sp. TMWB2A]|uniref:Dyp-type peroxidase n=1 Tax=Pseudonocardia sp. TMWB2A TaxID=687430 RepID=UPI00307FADF2